MKTIYDIFKELSTVRQITDEKYWNYEIRVRSMVTEVFEKKLTTTEIRRTFIRQGLQGDKLRESFALDPTMTDVTQRCES